MLCCELSPSQVSHITSTGEKPHAQRTCFVEEALSTTDEGIQRDTTCMEQSVLRKYVQKCTAAS